MTILIQVMAILIVYGCSKHQNRTLELTLNDSAFIKLTILNCSDTIEFSYKTSPMFPRGCVIRKIEITHDTVYYFSHKTTKPDYIDLELRKQFTTFVIPGDTLRIVANLIPDISDDNAIQIDDEFGEIYRFFSKRYEKLGYWNNSGPISNFSNISYPIDKVFSLTDSLFKSELEFLNYYKSTNDLPNWFYETMKADIEYQKVFIRPYLISFRKFFFKEQLFNPEIYYIFDQISLYNPKAKLSDYYYQCIDVCLAQSHEQDLEGKRGVARALPIFERSIPDAKEILKGEILDYYLAYKTSELFAASRNINEFERVDSLYNYLQPQFSNNEIIGIINDLRNYKTNYFASISINPFKFKEIIPANK